MEEIFSYSGIRLKDCVNVFLRGGVSGLESYLNFLEDERKTLEMIFLEMSKIDFKDWKQNRYKIFRYWTYIRDGAGLIELDFSNSPKEYYVRYYDHFTSSKTFLSRQNEEFELSEHEIVLLRYPQFSATIGGKKIFLGDSVLAKIRVYIKYKFSEHLSR